MNKSILLTAFFMIGGLGCNSVKEGSKKTMGADPTYYRGGSLAVDNAPVLKMVMKQTGQDDVVVATYASDDRNDTVFDTGKDINIDFSESTDESASVNYHVAFTPLTGGAALPTLSGVSSGHAIISGTRINEPGLYQARVVLSDAAGNERSKNIFLGVRCEDNENTFGINTAMVSITPDAELGYFNFNAANAEAWLDAGHTDRGFLYMWDFNGDGRYDTGWTDQSNLLAYSTYSGTRKVGIQMKDRYCQNVTSAQINFTAPSPLADGNTATEDAPLPAYYLLQGIVSNATHADQDIFGTFEALQVRATTVETLVSRDVEVHKVQCHYSVNATGTATLTVDGLYAYVGDETNALQTDDYRIIKDAKHGMVVNVQGIIDGLEASPSLLELSALIGDLRSSSSVTGIDVSDAYVSSVTFTSDFFLDEKATQRPAISGCTLTGLAIEGSYGTGTCGASGTSAWSNLYRRAHGSFNCLGGETTINQGEFFCEVNVRGDCPVGGGGGGGTSPNAI